MSLISITNLAAATIVLLAVYRLIIHPACISPLSKIPNAHWSAPFTSLWIHYTRYTAWENRRVLAAHEKLGPIVRLGPSEISVNSVDGGLRTIYGAGYEKGEWYSIFDNYGVPCMFSTLPGKPHAARKRMISNIYSKSTVQSSPALHAQAAQILYNRLLPILSSAAEKSTSVNVLEIWNATTMDGITAYQFGLAHASNFLQDPAYRKHWLDDLYQSRKQYTFFPQEMPRFTQFVHSLPFLRLYPKWVDAANQEIQEWVASLCKAAITSQEAGTVSNKPEDEAVVMNAVLAGYEKERMGKGVESVLADTTLTQPELSLYSEMLDHCAAGHETSGITMTYLSWHLSQNPSLQDALRAELKTLNDPIICPSPKSVGELHVPNSKQLDALPILHAVLMETLRLEASIPGSQPRMSPSPSSVLCGYEIPGNVRVSASAHALHRIESVFPDALTWDHTRWLDSEKKPASKEEESRRDRDRHFWAFSSGGKMCVGSNFAIHELKLITAAVYSNFRTHIVDDEGIEQTDGYTCGPRSNKLMLRFEKVDE